MPCYDPPPAWEGRQRENAHEAVRLLCDIVAMLMRATAHVSEDLLKWYVTHREIDLEIAKDERSGRKPYAEIVEIEGDIAWASALLAEKLPKP